jgi:hypothetical protein
MCCSGVVEEYFFYVDLGLMEESLLLMLLESQQR